MDSTAETVRGIVFDWLGDNEVWIDVMPQGDIFKAKADRTFTKENFQVLLYDPETNMLGMRMQDGMHKRMWDPMGHLPNKVENADLIIKGQVAAYHVNEDNPIVEWFTTVSQGSFEHSHPKCFSLLLLGAEVAEATAK